jgi:putative OPT family oligopeptide transporter
MTVEKSSFKPYVSAATKLKEFTPRAVVLGVLLSLLFGVSNAYLGLKIGTTVSASIPAAVMSMAILRIFWRKVSILENNLVQTMASVGEALAAGVIFTIPALYLMGEEPSYFRIFLLSALGGILGVLFMIPMRRYIIVQEHGKLPFPEGTACAEILKSGESGAHKAYLTIGGVVMGAVYKICSSALYFWNEVVTWVITPFQRTELSIDCTPALLGVGYIIGPRIAMILFSGGVMAWWVLIPLIRMFGEGGAVIYPGTVPIAQMTADDIWSNYVRYIGAGTVAVGGILGIFKIAPIIGKTLKIGFGELFQRATRSQQQIRTDRDISMRWLILGSVAIILTLWLLPSLPMNFLTICLLVLLGFFFVAVTSLTVGLVGSTSNPVSGMLITTLLITCLVFVSLGWTERIYLISAITMGCVACVAIAMAGTTSQDLKTGFLVGATPRLQQIGEIIGVILPALAIGATLHLLNQAYGFGSKSLPAPQASMLNLVVQGVMSGNIPYTLVVVGVFIGLAMECLKIPILPFALGVYLPLSLTTGTMIGGVVSYIVKRLSQSEETQERGVLTASGFVAGDACLGVLVAFLTVIGWVSADGKGFLNDAFSLFIYLALGAILIWLSVKPPKYFRARAKD